MICRRSYSRYTADSRKLWSSQRHLRNVLSNPGSIINVKAHMEGLMEVATAVDNNLKCLRLFCDQVEANVQVPPTQALGIHTEVFGERVRIKRVMTNRLCIHFSGCV